MTTASKITMARVALVPVFIILAILKLDYIALGVFIIAAATDWIDGHVARKYNQISTFGKFVDPLADKLLVIAALLIFVERGQMPAWACFIVVAREFAVSGLRLVAMENGTVIAAGTSGKIKTASSLICACIMLLPIHSFALLPWLTVDVLCVAVIVLTTVYSGVEYFAVNKGAMDLSK